MNDPTFRVAITDINKRTTEMFLKAKAAAKVYDPFVKDYLLNLSAMENMIVSTHKNHTIEQLLDILEKYGTMSREQVLLPAINLAEKGFMPGPITSYWWRTVGVDKLIAVNNVYNNYYELTMGNNTKQGPKIGDIMINKYIGNTLRKLMVYGKNEYYNDH